MKFRRSFWLIVGSSLSLKEKLLTHAAACCSLLGFGYVTKPKIDLLLQSREGG
jgi:hypothetical protein